MTPSTRSTLAAEPEPGPDRFDKLLEWFCSVHHGQVHKALEIYTDPKTGLSLRVRKDSKIRIETYEPVVVCPMSASLSYVNALYGGYALDEKQQDASKPVIPFPTPFMAEVPPHVIGRFFLMQQFLLGSQSRWAPYIATLPQPKNFDAWALPAVWPEKNELARLLLKGTNADVAVVEMKERINSEFAHASAYLKETKDKAWSGFTVALYEWAYCIFTSRSFRPSLVLPPELRALLSRTTEEPKDERGDQHRHAKAANKAQLPIGCGIDDFSVLLPVLDIGNHDPRAPAQWVMASGETRSPLNNYSVLTPVPLETENDAVVFRVGNHYGPGQQVFNNYGPKTNSELLVGYGFVLPPTAEMHNDYVHLRKRGELATMSEAAGEPSVYRDFLLSLRPIDDASSIVGRLRLQSGLAIQKVPRRKRTPGFSNFDDGLLSDMLLHIASVEDRERIQRYVVSIFHGHEFLVLPMDTVKGVMAADLLQTMTLDVVFGDVNETVGLFKDIKADFSDIAYDIRSTLLYKMAKDEQTLFNDDPPQYGKAMDSPSGFVPETPQERVASQYREQYRAVVKAALQALEMDHPVEDDE